MMNGIRAGVDEDRFGRADGVVAAKVAKASGLGGQAEGTKPILSGQGVTVVDNPAQLAIAMKINESMEKTALRTIGNMVMTPEEREAVMRQRKEAAEARRKAEDGEKRREKLREGEADSRNKAMSCDYIRELGKPQTHDEYRQVAEDIARQQVVKA